MESYDYSYRTASDKVLKEEMRSAFQFTPIEDIMDELKLDYPISFENLWELYWDLSNSESDKKTSKKILKVLGLA